jgi:hypothetical protein
MIRTSAVGIASMNDLTDASGATFANDGPLESVGILASNVQRSPAASIFALRYDGPTSDFRSALPLLHTDPRISPFVEAFESNDPILHWSWAAEE